MAVCDLHIALKLPSLRLMHEWGMPPVSQTTCQKKTEHLKLNGFHSFPSSTISVIHSQKHISHFKTTKIQIITTYSCVFGYTSNRRMIWLLAVIVLENFPLWHLSNYLLFEPFGLTVFTPDIFLNGDFQLNASAIIRTSIWKITFHLPV